MTAIVAELDPGPPIDGPLAGVRTTVKELIAVRGVELSANTAVELPSAMVDAAAEAAVVEQLRAAGAAITSTSTTHELAWGITSWTDGRRVANPIVGGRVAGGSSGGAAVAVRAGLADLGVGTDTAGSIRIPAAWCGVVGWKPPFDLIPLDGVLPLAPGFDTVGFLARDVARLERVADVVGAGPERTEGSLRWAVLGPSGPRDARLDRMLEGIDGARLDPPPADLLGCFATLQLAASLQVHRDRLRTWPAQADRYGEAIAGRLRRAEQLSDADIERAASARSRLVRAVDGWFGSVDAIVLPTTGCEPPTQERPDEIELDGEWHDLRSVVLPHTTIANLTGLPAVSVPVELDGAPTGVQVLCAPGRDRLALRAAATLAAALP